MPFSAGTKVESKQALDENGGIMLRHFFGIIKEQYEDGSFDVIMCKTTYPVSREWSDYYPKAIPCWEHGEVRRINDPDEIRKWEVYKSEY